MIIANLVLTAALVQQSNAASPELNAYLNHPNVTPSDRNRAITLSRRQLRTPTLKSNSASATTPTPSAASDETPTPGDTPATTPLATAATRDPAYWPFSIDSPWNTSLGSGAIYETINSPVFSTTGGASLNVRQWSHPVFIAKSTDPIRVFFVNNVVVAVVRCPADAAPDSQSDGSMHVISPDHKTVVETWRAVKVGYRYNCSAAVVNQLTDQGVYPNWHGVRAGGASALGGLVRKEELQRGEIPHVLAVCVQPKALNNRAPGGKAWVWPASWADGATNPGGSYSSTGNLYMGSLVAIPPEVNLAALGLSSQGMVFARAMQDFGAIIIETGGANICYYAEPAAAPYVSSSVYSDLRKISNYLKVVTNNTPLTVGGGGTRRQPPAPPPQ